MTILLLKQNLLGNKKTNSKKLDIAVIMGSLPGFIFDLIPFSFYFVDSFYFRKLKF